MIYDSKDIFKNTLSIAYANTHHDVTNCKVNVIL